MYDYAKIRWETGIHDSPLASYEQIFKDNGGESLIAYVDDYVIQNGKPPLTLNLLGQTRAIREMGVPGVSVSLEDVRPDPVIADDLAHGVLHLVQDANDCLKLYYSLRQILANNGQLRFGLIFARPIAGDYGLTSKTSHLVDIFTVIIDLLEPDGLFEYWGTPGKISQSEYAMLLDTLMANTGRGVEPFIKRGQIVGWKVRRQK